MNPQSAPRFLGPRIVRVPVRILEVAFDGVLVHISISESIFGFQYRKKVWLIFVSSGRLGVADLQKHNKNTMM